MHELEFLFNLTDDFLDVFLKVAFMNALKKRHADSNCVAGQISTWALWFLIYLIIPLFIPIRGTSWSTPFLDMTKSPWIRRPLPWLLYVWTGHPPPLTKIWRWWDCTACLKIHVRVYALSTADFNLCLKQRACRTRSRSCASVSWPGSIRPYSGPTPCCRSRRAAFWMQKWRQRYQINSY